MDLSVQQFRTKAEQELLDLYTKAQKTLPGAKNPFVADLRKKAIATYARLGLPHRRIEAWKYTDLRAHLEDVYPLATPHRGTIGTNELEAALGKAIAAFSAYRLVIVEGELREDLSDMSALKDAGAEITSLAQALETPPAWLKETLSNAGPREDDAVFALNTALMTGGVTLRLPKGLTLDKPIHLIHLDGTGDPASMVTRNVIVAEEGTSATILESYGSFGMKGLQRNAVTESEIGDKAAILGNHAGRRGRFYQKLPRRSRALGDGIDVYSAGGRGAIAAFRLASKNCRTAWFGKTQHGHVGGLRNRDYVRGHPCACGHGDLRRALRGH